MLCSLALRAGFGNILDLKCGCLRQELCAALIEQCDMGRQSIILHGKEYNLSPTTFATIIGVGDGGTHVDLNDQAVDIINLRSSGPRGIHIVEVLMRDPNRLHKPQQTEPPRWNNVNNYAFQLLMESEIIVSTDDQFISMHNFMSLLPNTVLSKEICGVSILTMIAYHLTLCERAKPGDAPINWYLPTLYVVSIQHYYAAFTFWIGVGILRSANPWIRSVE
ncbi:hypothetical protein WN943_025213 [Citrus x changshan-huyou]